VYVCREGVAANGAAFHVAIGNQVRRVSASGRFTHLLHSSSVMACLSCQLCGVNLFPFHWQQFTPSMLPFNALWKSNGTH
jgi:hypothetical protein